MDEKEIAIISIIENEFMNLSVNNLIQELKKIPQYDFKNTRNFILKLFRDIDTATKNVKTKIKKYFQSLKTHNDQIIKKIYFHSRNKPLLSKNNTKDSNVNENFFYQTQTINNNKDCINYDNIQSIKNLKSSEESSIKENEELFTKNILEMKYFSGNNGVKGGGLKFKKKINLGNKSLSEFKIKSKKKISVNDNKKANYNIYKLYHNVYSKNIIKDKNNKSNSINGNKIELSLNANKKENDYFSNTKLFKQINLKKKIHSMDKKIPNNNINLLNNYYNEKKENLKFLCNTENNNNYDNINKDKKIKDYRNELNNVQEKNLFKDNSNFNNNISQENIRNFNIIIENNNINLANDIIKFIDNMKNLQKNIINKNPNIKEMKYNFEKNKYLLYQKAIKLSQSSITEFKNNNRNIKKDLDFNLNNKISKTFSIVLKNTIKNNNNNTNLNSENTKELNISIINLRKSIEDIKNNSQFLTDQLKSEVNILNNKLKDKNEKEKEYEKNIMENLSSIKKIYKILLPNCLEQNNLLNSIELEILSPSTSTSDISEKKFNWYSNEIIKFIDIIINKSKNSEIQNTFKNENEKLIESNKKDETVQIEIINIKEIRNELQKNIFEILNMINPFISKEKEKDKNNTQKQIETFLGQDKMKEALDILKSKIKEVINYIENLNLQNKNKKKEQGKIKLINRINNKNNLSCDEEDEENLNDKNNFLQLNSTLLGIQNDLIQKIENKQEEIEKIKKDLKNSIQLNQEFMSMAKNQKGQDVNIFAEKYKYLLDLFNSEQEKVKFLQNEYMSLLNGLSNYVNNGDEIIVELKKMWNLNPIIKTNFEIAEPEFPDIDPINETDLLTEKS